jgi:hypothetical protein
MQTLNKLNLRIWTVFTSGYGARAEASQDRDLHHIAQTIGNLLFAWATITFRKIVLLYEVCKFRIES